jgi:hypothetical protein
MESSEDATTEEKNNFRIPDRKRDKEIKSPNGKTKSVFLLGICIRLPLGSPSHAVFRTPVPGRRCDTRFRVIIAAKLGLDVDYTDIG